MSGLALLRLALAAGCVALAPMAVAGPAAPGAVLAMAGGLVLIAIPLAVGLITFRRSAQQSGQ